MELRRIAVDTSEALFTLHGVDVSHRALLRRDIRRAGLEDFFGKLPPTVVALEACGGSHYGGRGLTGLGPTAQLIPSQYVKPFAKRGKDDRNDADAISEAAARPQMPTVAVRSASAWLPNLLERKPRKPAAVALANKMARIVRAMRSSGEAYRRQPLAG